MNFSKSRVSSLNIRELSLILLAIFIVLGLLFGWFWYRTHGPGSSNISDYQIEQTDLDKIMTEIGDHAKRGEFHEALAKTDNSFNKYKSDQTAMYSLHNAKAHICMGKKDYRCAINSYLAADKLTSSFNSLLNVATAAEAAGDSDLAREYYQKALALAEEKPDEYDAETLEALRGKL